VRAKHLKSFSLVGAGWLRLCCFLMSTAYICVTCGAQFPPSAEPQPTCPICTDSRQFVGLDGQQWTTLEELSRKHHNIIQKQEANLYSIYTEPHFAIGQRAFLLQTPQGNVLWDCLALVDQPTVDAIRELGGIAAIAISHPHYYTTMVEWSLALDSAPIHLHSADRQWVMRPHASVQHWSGDSRKLLADLILIRTPGHFDGYQVLYWPGGSDRKGVLLSGDQPQVCMDTGWVSFMYSYPNYIPLGAQAIRQILTRLDPYKFDRVYGAFPKRTVVANAKDIVRRSAERFMRAIVSEV
jgi:hypothetical protein